MNRPFIRVLGLALGVSGCHRSSDPISQPPPPPIGNPPPPDAVPPIAEVPTMDPPPSGNPPIPSDLPTWESVKSGHPEGATNPPFPLLIVSKDPEACFKTWISGMMKPDDEVMDLNGRVVATPADAAGATQVQCPPDQPQKLLAAAAKRDAAQRSSGKP